MTAEPPKRTSPTVDDTQGEERAPSAERRHRRQERGLRRVDAILDAAAEVLCEGGVAGVTMHRVARRSGTTTGSMYHFFPDRGALLRGLAERHGRALRELVARVERENAGKWGGLTTDQAVGCFLEPFLSYLDRHPELVPLSRLARAGESGVEQDAELSRLIVGLAEAVVASRDESATPAEVTVRAVAMTAMVEGVVTAAARRTVPAESLRRELRRAVVAYLDSYARR